MPVDIPETERSLANSKVYVVYQYYEGFHEYGPPVLVCETQQYADAFCEEKGKDYTWEAFVIR